LGQSKPIVAKATTATLEAGGALPASTIHPVPGISKDEEQYAATLLQADQDEADQKQPHGSSDVANLKKPALAEESSEQRKQHQTETTVGAVGNKGEKENTN
ncbi:unnamed protein product, partial [Amoebophrya sp. A25]